MPKRGNRSKTGGLAKRTAAEPGLAESHGPVPGSSQPRLTRGRKWLFRLLAVVSPLALLLVLELGLRLGGYGYPVSFFVDHRVGGRDVFVGNKQFSWRFFDPALARAPRPLHVPQVKAGGTCRIFVLGESAAFGDPLPDFGLPRVLEALLSEKFPGVRFEVVNAAMTAINSHAILPIARDCAERDGDVWVVYMGNNEVVGPFGAGTVFGPRVPSLGAIRAGLAFKGTRTGELFSDLLRRFSGRAGADVEWRGMSMFLENQVAQDDPRMARVYAHFERNLADILAEGKRSRSKVVLGTVVSNLKDCAPFASRHRPGLSPAQLEAWEKEFRAGTEAEQAGDLAGAIGHYRQAAGVDDDFAELHFRWGRCSLALGRADEAREQLVRARDLDTLRFRADTRINDILRRGAAGGDAVLVDAELAAAGRSPGGVPGRELLYEHVHFTFEGNYYLAREFARAIGPLVREKFGAASAPALAGADDDWPSLEACAARLAWTEWGRYESVQTMISRMNDPPFTTQFNAGEHQARMRGELEKLQPALAPDGLRSAAEAHRRALARAPDDWVLHKNLGRILEQLGDWEGAGAAWGRVCELIPLNYEAHLGFGLVLTRGGRHADAVREFQAALDLKPDCVPALNGWGLALVAQGQADQALDRYRQALKCSPDSSETHLNLGMALGTLGKTDEAKVHLRRALDRKLNSPAAMISLGKMCMSQGWTSEAVSNFTAAVRLDPANPTAHFGLAGSLVTVGKTAEATEHFAEAVRLRPDYAEARLGLGIELGRQGKHAEALEQFQQAARLKPGLIEARLNFGIALLKLGRTAEALGEFKDALRINPNNAVARKYLQALEPGR